MKLKQLPRTLLDGESTEDFFSALVKASNHMRALQSCMGDLERDHEGFYICSAHVYPGDVPEMLVLSDTWLKLAYGRPDNCKIEPLCFEGAGSGSERRYRLSLTFNGCIYSCIMSRREMNRLGIEVSHEPD